MDAMKRIRAVHGVPAQRHAKVVVHGKPALIVGASRGRILVRFDGEKFPRAHHPKLGVEYANE